MMGLPCPTPSPADLLMPNQMNTVEIFIENTTLVIKLFASCYFCSNKFAIAQGGPFHIRVPLAHKGAPFI